MNTGDKVKIRFNGMTFTAVYQRFHKGKHVVVISGIKGELFVNQVYPIEQTAS
jgi:nitrate reductase NapAB chaperone NapD